jgi:hypothetical protein
MRFLIFVATIALACPLLAESHSRVAEKLLYVEVSYASYSASTGLKLEWKIKNISPRQLQVYTSYLHDRPAGYELRSNGTLDVHTSLLVKLRGTANYYRKATFRVLKPNEELSGAIEDPQPQTIGAASEHPLRVRLFVSCGKVVDLSRALERAYTSGTEHEANPIVDWQTLQLSKPVDVTPVRKGLQAAQEK